MNTLFLLIAVAILLVLGSQVYVTVIIAKLRRSGDYPLPGQATMADVERLHKQGLSTWAMRCYREIHGCSLRQAKEAIEKLG
ncbi:MAG: hypothetical protein D3M94_21810 [Rhodocyclales bacterium GT-UBC]|nr:MAG: hypothetical protein D3M94_21810 [Rhodocyclales bacterium GT-UBC]